LQYLQILAPVPVGEPVAHAQQGAEKTKKINTPNPRIVYSEHNNTLPMLLTLVLDTAPKGFHTFKRRVNEWHVTLYHIIRLTVRIKHDESSDVD
jgi:hypothetical protein